MAKQTVKSGLVGKLGNKIRQAVDAHKGDETKISGGGGDLPAGIEHGIAQLAMCKFGVYEKGNFQGEYYFMAQGIVLSPKKHDGIPIEGLRTSIGPEPICDTPSRSRTTVEEHVAWVLNEMRKLGVDTSELSADDLETTAEALQQTKPYFRFRTWAGEPTEQYPNPLINHSWGGVVDYSPDEDGEEGDDEVVDNTEEEAEVEAEVEEEAEAEEEVEAEEGESTLAELAELADGGDADAAGTLQEKAIEAGIDQGDIDNSASWAAVVELIEAASIEVEEAEETVDLEALGVSADEGDEDSAATLRTMAEEAGLDPDDGETYPDWATLAAALAGGEEASEEEEEFVPEMGGVYLYTPPGSKKPIECEVTVLGKTTVSLKSLDDPKKVFKSVPHDKLTVQ